MTAVVKISSNVTGLRYAREQSLGVLPGTPTWYPLEPNDYSDFGGQVTTVARSPISNSRRRKKGVVTDLDASGGFSMDLTQTNLRDLNQDALFNNESTNPQEDTLTNVDGTGNDYEKVGGFADFRQGHLVLAAGFSNAANNGVKVVTTRTGVDNLPVTDTGIVNETPAAAASLKVVGYQGAATELAVDAAGILPKITFAAVKATGVLTFTGIVANNETVTIGTRVYTFKTALTPAANEVLIGADQDTALTNLKDAINLTGTPGTQYGSATTIHADVSGVADTVANTLTVTAKKFGFNGNLIATTETMVNGAWGGALLTGGTGIDVNDLNVVDGQTIFIGDDSNMLFGFATAANNGWKRINLVDDAANAIFIDKSVLTMVTDAGTGKTIRVFVGNTIRDGATRKTVQLERSLGAPDDALPTQIQSEYLTKSVLNEWTYNIPTADKVTIGLAFVSGDNEQRTGAQGLKSGTRPNLVESDAFNTSTDVTRIKMAIVSTTDEAPTALFTYLTDLTLTINNNVSPNKAVGVLGAFDLTEGFFELGGTVTAYFTDVASIQAIRNNSSVTLEFQLVKNNAGITVDVPLMTLGNGRLEIAQNEAVTIPLDLIGAEHAGFAHTIITSYFDYLPNDAG